MRTLEDVASSVRALGMRILEKQGVGEERKLHKSPIMCSTKSSQVVNAYSMTKCKQLIIRTQDVLAHNVLEAQRQPPETGSALEAWTDYEHIRRLSRFTAADLEGMITTAVDRDNNTFQLLPEQVALAWLVTRGPSLSAARIGDYTYSPPAASCASFSWITSTMGSGKSIVALSVVLYAIGHGWEEARSKLGEWSATAVNNDPVHPFVPMAHVRPGVKLCPSRVAIIIVPAPVANQWKLTIRANLPEGHYFVVVDGKDTSPKLPLVLDLLKGTDKPSIILVVLQSSCTIALHRSKCLNQIGDMSGMALAALVVDEAPLVASMVAGRSAGSMEWPPIFRTVMLTAQPIKLLSSDRLRGSSVTALKALIFENPGIGTTRGAKMMKRRRDAFIRFSLADSSVCVQRELSAAASARMPAKINLQNVWLPSTSLRDLAPSLCTPFLGNINSWAQGLAYMMSVRTGVTVDARFMGRASPVEEVATLVGDVTEAMRTHDEPDNLPIELAELEALSGRLREPRLCAACLPAAPNAATVVLACCGNLLCEEHAHVNSSTGCAACSPTLEASNLDVLRSTHCVGVHCAMGHVLRVLLHEGHTRIMLLLSRDAVHLMNKRRDDYSRRVHDDIKGAVKLAAPTTGVVDCANDEDALALFNGAEGASIIMLTDSVFDDSMAMTGVDLPQCDAVLAVGRMKNEAQAYSRALRLSPKPRPELPVVRILWTGCNTGPTPVPLEMSPPVAPLASTPTFVRDVLQATLRLDPEADMEEWGYNHLALRSFSFTFRGEGFERLVVAAPAVTAVDGDAMGQLTFTFANCVFSECVPDQTRGITLRHEGDGLRFSWVSGTHPPVRLRPVAHCTALDLEVITANGTKMEASATAEPVEDEQEKEARVQKRRRAGAGKC